jgi:cytochrome P450
MSVSSPSPIVDVDPFSDEFLRDPFPRHAELRDAGPVVRLERYGIWAAARYEEVFAALMDPQQFVSSAGVGITNFHREPPPRPPSIILEADPPLQTRTHKILARAMSPAALRALREPFEREAEALVERLLAERDVEGFAQIAQGYPLKVFPDAVGLPVAGREALPAYGDIVFNFFGPHNERFDRAMAAAPAVSKAIMAICERDLVTPDGLAANVFAACDAGECTYAEAGMLVRSMLSAGLDTTVSSIGCALVAFARYPDQWDAVRENPSLAKNAFDEAIRFESPAQTFFRTASRTGTFGGVELEAGDKLLLFLASANRDPRKWERPDYFDVRRKTGAHVGFGVGIHRCVGEMLSKLEGEILFATMARRIARFELTDEPNVRLNNTMRGYDRIPLRLHAS